jgi:hypothetical protein
MIRVKNKGKGEKMKKVLWSYIVIGIINIALSILNAVGVASSLKAINEVIRIILPFLAIKASLDAISDVIPKLSFFLRDFSSPLIGWAVSIILFLSGIGIVLRKSWGKTFAYIYAITIIFLSLIAMPVIMIGCTREFTHIEKYGFLKGLVWAEALLYILTLIGTLLYPIILLIFLSRPKIKELFKK